MIQTKTQITYGDRSEKTAIIKIERRLVNISDEGNTYNVIDFEIIDGVPNAIFTETVFKTTEEIDERNAFIEADYSSELEGLTYTEKERKKQQISLMIDVTSNVRPNGDTIYRVRPEDWEFSN